LCARLQTDAGRTVQCSNIRVPPCSSRISICGNSAPRRPSGRTSVQTVLVTEAPANVDLPARSAGRISRTLEPVFVPRKRADTACIVYSSERVAPERLHDDARKLSEQCVALTAIYPFWPGVRYLSILPTNTPLISWSFFRAVHVRSGVVHLRTLRPEYVREAFPKYKSLCESRSCRLKTCKKDCKHVSRRCRRVSGKFQCACWLEQSADENRPRPGLSRLLLKQVHEAFGGELRPLLSALSVNRRRCNFFTSRIPVATDTDSRKPHAITVNDLKPFRADTVASRCLEWKCAS